VVAETTERTVRGLRDFFLACDADAMRRAYYVVAESDERAPVVEDWADVEFAFNRIFVGPRVVSAPPFASVYLDAQPSLMGPSSLEMRHLYEVVGLVSPWAGSMPDDHLGLELDAFLQLRVALADDDSTALRPALQHLTAHMRAWLPRFGSRVRSDSRVPAAVLYMIDRLEEVIPAEDTEQTTRSDPRGARRLEPAGAQAWKRGERHDNG